MPKTDSLGRGLKGFARGAIVQVAIARKRKNGTSVDYQTEFRWRDNTGAHRRYLRKAIVAPLSADWESGLTAKEIICKYNLMERKR